MNVRTPITTAESIKISVSAKPFSFLIIKFPLYLVFSLFILYNIISLNAREIIKCLKEFKGMIKCLDK